MLLDPSDLGLALALQQNEIAWGCTALCVDSWDAQAIRRALEFAFCVLSGRGEVHLTTPSSSSTWSALSASYRLERLREALKRSHKV